MTRKINIKQDRQEIARIIGINLDLMVEKKTKKGIVINYPMVENIADCILVNILGGFENGETNSN